MKRLLFALFISFAACAATSAHAIDYHEVRPFGSIKSNYNTNYSANNYYQAHYDRGAFFHKKDKYKYWKAKQSYVEGQTGN